LDLFDFKAALQNKVSDPSTEQSTSNWKAIGDKDKFLDEVRGKESDVSVNENKIRGDIFKIVHENSSVTFITDELYKLFSSIVNERKDNIGIWTDDKEVIKTVSFGDYISVEQKRYGCANEFYTHKVISTLESNTWMDVPAVRHEEAKTHKTVEKIVLCICCGMAECKVIRYRIEDIHSIKKPESQAQNNNVGVSDTIEFAEWLFGEGYTQYDGKERWINFHNDNHVYSTKELHKIFSESQSKQLNYAPSTI
jgi:hypothetical protein